MRISLIMAIYNGFDADRLALTLQAARWQQGIDLEICVAESNPTPSFAARARDFEVRYTFLPSEAVSNPGRVRNAALGLARGDYVYSSDVDILFPTGFFSQLTALPRGIWIHPPKRRLPKEHFSTFFSRSCEQSLAPAIEALWKDDFFASVGEPVKYRLTEKDGKYYTCVAADHAVWKSSPALRERAPEFWDSTRHRGGTFAPRDLWLRVGGYADVYRAWGYEDADVQWKLSTIQRPNELPNEERFRVLHLDHSKGYFSPQHHHDNKQRFEARKATPHESIQHDRLHFEAAQP